MPRRRRQFSLRRLFVLLFLAAVACAVWRAWGATAAFSIFAAVLLAAPLSFLQGTRRGAYLIAALAAYGPFLTMAGYMQLFVACSHCKSTSWMLLPVGPGLLVVDRLRHWLDLPRPPDSGWFAAALLVSLALVGMIGWLLGTRHWPWGLAAALLTLASCVYSALVTFALIRA